MATTVPLPPDELERLVAEIDAGVYDDELRAPRGQLEGQPALPQLERFSEVKPFDVRAWATRNGVKLPDRA